MEWDYEMKILASHKSPLSCQIHEGHLISNLPGTRNPQQEGKVGENLPPKLIVEDQKEQKGECNGPQDISKNGGKRTNTASPGEPKAEAKERRFDPDLVL